MKKFKTGVVFLFVLFFSSVYGQDTLVVSTDSIVIKHGCICDGLYKNKSDIDSCRNKINQSHEKLLERFKTTDEKHPNRCKDYYLPYIDFSKKNLIVATGYFGGCVQPKIEHTLYKITSEKKYKLVVKIIDLSLCKAKIPVSVYLLVPKLEEGYTFEYKVFNNRN